MAEQDTIIARRRLETVADLSHYNRFQVASPGSAPHILSQYPSFRPCGPRGAGRLSSRKTIGTGYRKDLLFAGKGGKRDLRKRRVNL